MFMIFTHTHVCIDMYAYERVTCACAYVSLAYVVLGASQKKVCPGTEVTYSCELPCGCWKLNPGPLQEQQVFLTAEPSLQLLKSLCVNVLHSLVSTHCVDFIFSNVGTYTKRQVSVNF